MGARGFFRDDLLGDLDRAVLHGAAADGAVEASTFADEHVGASAARGCAAGSDDGDERQIFVVFQV